jgi:hypothetical protein
LATGTTNEFNALCNLTASDMLRLEILALSGDSPVSNAFTEEADRLGLTTKGRERKEREEQRKFAVQMEALRQRAAEFSKHLDFLEQATAEALHENEEQLRNSREDLRRIRERAYEITMPDGNVEKVYRDGDKVRTDSGTEVDRDIIRAEDIPDALPSWSERKLKELDIDALMHEQRRLTVYQEKLAHARSRSGSDDLSGDELDGLKAGLDEMPDSVRSRVSPEPKAAVRQPDPDRPYPRLSTGDAATGGPETWWLVRQFVGALKGDKPAPTENPDITWTRTPTAPNPNGEEPAPTENPNAVSWTRNPTSPNPLGR